MSTTIHCPSCNRQLKVPDELLGTKVQCPGCGMTFAVTNGHDQGQPEERPEETGRSDRPPRPVRPLDEYDDDEEPRRRRLDDDWDGEREGLTRGAITAPAVCLLVTGILGFLADVFNVIYAATMTPEQILAAQPGLPQWWQEVQKNSVGPQAAITSSIFVVVSAVVILGAIQMLRRKTWGVALAGSILAILNIGNFCCVLGLPFGIWSIVVLSRTKSSFE